MEKYVPIGEDKIYAKRELAEGNYLIQSAHDQTIYMNYSSDSSRIFPGKGDKSKVWRLSLSLFCCQKLIWMHLV